MKVKSNQLNILLILSFFSFLTINSLYAEIDTLRVATFNIRIISSSDTGDKSWSSRKQYVAKVINDYDFDIVGVQEISNESQESDLMALLPDYTCFSRGRGNSGGTSGERVGIVYKKDRFEMQENGFFFISETPDIVGPGWDALYSRIAVWAKMFDKLSGEFFYFFNVHLDHRGPTSRIEGTKLLVSRMMETGFNENIFCVGDFNTTSQNTAMYTAMTSRFSDSRVVSQTPPTGFVGTSNGFNMTATNFTESSRIDFIFTNNPVFSYACINDKYVAGSYPSDHFPVMIETVLKRTQKMTFYVDGKMAVSGDGTKGSPYKTIEEAIQVMDNLDTVFVAAGTYLPGESAINQQASFNFTKSFYLKGETDEHNQPLTIISGDVNGDDVYDETSGKIISGNEENLYSIIRSSAAMLSVKNIIIRGGNASHSTHNKGAAIYNTGNLELKNVHITGNSASYGAGIYNTGKITADSCFFIGNTASLHGAALYIDHNNADIDIRNSLFSNGEAIYGSAILLKNAARCFFMSNSFISNQSKNFGTISIYDPFYAATTTFVNNTFANNVVHANGQTLNRFGGSAVYIYASPDCKINLVNNTIVGNIVEGLDRRGNITNYLGGAVYLHTGNVALHNNLIAGNFTQSGYGDFYSTSETYVTSNNIFSTRTSSNVNLTDSDYAAASNNASLIKLQNMMYGSVTDTLFVPAIKINRGFTPTIQQKNNQYGTYNINRLTLSNLDETILNIDLNNDGLLQGVLETDQRGIIRNTTGNAFIGAIELTEDEFETDIRTLKAADNLYIVVQKNTIRILTDTSSAFAIYNLSGSLLTRGKLSAGENIIPIQTNPGILMFQITEKPFKRSFKVIIH